MNSQFHNGVHEPESKKQKMDSPNTQNNTFLFTSESVGEGHPGKKPSSVLECRTHSRVYDQTCIDSMKFTLNIFRSDKICDQISDAILDAHIKQDPHARVACGKYNSYFSVLFCADPTLLSFLFDTVLSCDVRSVFISFHISKNCLCT